ncbi:hypothetical protein [Caulobacter sp. 17J65-9]|uniref:hypothetical protein n=1 Tax=Caulobacter sp. 17J65-9 TaxID=2709382 RepID=UPI0013C7E3AD|nr:hypothetical protein [Caulobacter sp. 17J65-9]NEX91161.1 hypothetical protein [Caulobacter sp. 17J65-9]
MQAALTEPTLPNLFGKRARSSFVRGLGRATALCFAGDVLLKTCNQVAFDPEAKKVDSSIAKDPRWRAAVSIALPLALWGDLRHRKVFEDRAARMNRIVRNHGAAGPVGLAAAAAQRLAAAATDLNCDQDAVLSEAIDLAIQSEVLHAAHHGRDVSRARAAVELRVLNAANALRPTMH